MRVICCKKRQDLLKLILVRHGETEWNREEIFRGRADVHLNETGIRQAELLADYLKEADIEAILSSPLKRAISTAEIVARPHRLAVETVFGLIDFDYGEWGATTRREAENRYPALYQEWLTTPHLVTMPGGECLMGMRKRALDVVNSVVSSHSGTVVLVSHRAVNKVIICALLGLDDSHFWNIRMDNAAITTFEYQNGTFILAGHNDTSFLKRLQKAPLRDF
jgi:broad specificity phosphatase PhoE